MIPNDTKPSEPEENDGYEICECGAKCYVEGYCESCGRDVEREGNDYL